MLPKCSLVYEEAAFSYSTVVDNASCTASTIKNAVAKIMAGTRVPPLPLGGYGTLFLFFHFLHWKWRQTRGRLLEETVEVKLYCTLSYLCSCLEYFGIFTDFTSWKFLSAHQIGSIIVDRIAKGLFSRSWSGMNSVSWILWWHDRVCQHLACIRH